MFADGVQPWESPARSATSLAIEDEVAIPSLAQTSRHDS